MIVVVRHGRTAANASGLLLGRADPPLDDVGHEQAAAVAAGLPRPDRVVSSPLARCRGTAASFGVDVDEDPRFVELDYGEWDGRPVSDVTSEEWARWRTDLGWAPPGGESLAALGVRVRAGLADLAADPRSESGVIVVVTHVSPVKAALAWALGVGDEVAWRCFVAPGSVTEIAVAGGRPSLRSFGLAPRSANR